MPLCALPRPMQTGSMGLGRATCCLPSARVGDACTITMDTPHAPHHRVVPNKGRGLKLGEITPHMHTPLLPKFQLVWSIFSAPWGAP